MANDVMVEEEIFTVEEFRTPVNLDRLDEACTEVFGVMFGCEIQPRNPADQGPTSELPGGDRVTAVVGFAGPVRGSCEVRMSMPAALAVATAMMGFAPEPDEVQSSMCDAVGEVCNMLAGGWKHRVPALVTRLMLAPNTVVSGSNYHVHSIDALATIHRVYTFNEHTLLVTLTYKKF
jgi:chemotaxis protein CheX